MSMSRKAIICTVLATILMSAHSFASTLGDYFEVAAGVVPNKVHVSISQDVVYRDNVNSSPDKKDGYEFNTGLSVN